jgi:hypothetical protein
VPSTRASKKHFDHCGQAIVRYISGPRFHVSHPRLPRQLTASACIHFVVPLEQLGGKKHRQKQTLQASIIFQFVSQLAVCLELASKGYHQWLRDVQGLISAVFRYLIKGMR